MHTITQEHLMCLEQWFKSYVEPFRLREDISENIDLKIDHTQRVCEEIAMIGDALGLDEHSMRFAEIIARFHDVGRFEQYAEYRTYADAKSVDHAAFGVQVLQREHVLDILSPEMQDLIFRTIRYHNRASLPSGESDECLFFSRMLRDADKLDIWRVVIEYYYRKDRGENRTIQLDLPDTPGVSERVYDALMHHRIVKTEYLQNLNDFKLLQAGWVYDCNFKPTLKAVREREYLEKIQRTLPKDDRITALFSEFHQHVEEHS